MVTWERVLKTQCYGIVVRMDTNWDRQTGGYRIGVSLSFPAFHEFLSSDSFLIPSICVISVIRGGLIFFGCGYAARSPLWWKWPENTREYWKTAQNSPKQPKNWLKTLKMTRISQYGVAVGLQNWVERFSFLSVFYLYRSAGRRILMRC